MKPDIQLMVTVARMYHRDGLKQEDVARKVGVSRAAVSLILTEARRQGIVEIKIRNPLSDDAELSREMHRHFNLRQCVVVPTVNRTPDVLIDLVAHRAISVFDEHLRVGDAVGIAWGRTCHSFMSSYESTTLLHSNEVLPLVGGSKRILKPYQLNEMVRAFAEKLQGTPHFVHAPALAESVEDYRLYMNSASMHGISAKWNTVDLAVVSCGLSPVTTEFDGSEAGRSRSIQDAPPNTWPIGDICARYYDIQGRFVSSNVTERTIAIPAVSLKEIRTVICIVGSVEKAYSTLGALRTGVIDVLVIDEQTARAVLRSLERDEEGTLESDIALLFRG